MKIKRGWIVLLLLVGIAVPTVTHAQVAAYGEFSATKFYGGYEQNYLYGATAGILVDGLRMGHKALLSADIQGRFIGKNGERMDGVTVGPRFSFDLQRLKLSPFAEFMVGFARHNDGQGNSSSDSTIQVNTGVTRRINPRWDAVVDYSYSQFYYNGGQFNPKTFSIGGVFHFAKR